MLKNLKRKNWFVEAGMFDNKEKANYQVEGIYYILIKIFDYAASNNISTLEAANLLAERRIQDYIKWNHQ